ITTNGTITGGVINAQKLFTASNLEINNGGSGHTILNAFSGGNVGVGTDKPIYKLDVGGDMHTNGNLRADSNLLVNGNIGIGTSSPKSKLDVGGNIHTSGSLTVDSNFITNGNFITKGNLLFGGGKAISYFPPVSGSNELFLFGDTAQASVNFLRHPVIGSGTGTGSTPCNNPSTVNGFPGMLLSFTHDPTYTQYISMQMGSDGANGIIDVAGTNSIGPSGLLLNYYCGKDIDMCTGTNGGNINMINGPASGIVNICNGPLGGNVNICNGNGTSKGLVNLGITHIGPQTQTTGPHTDAILTVSGKMVAQSCYIRMLDWADYVFASNYKLPNLMEVEKYYKLNSHLPEVPSEKEIKEKGVDVGEMNKVLLKKVEELTIYLVEQQKQIDQA
ncbi:MAG TPA: hypothetical protein VNZ86_07650, partial [Bacteroidia bacterium]|nr:hypothetical protein [Bacteroidia bacterium]